MDRLFNRRAQGISINVIIIAAIALLVLVILSIIFTGRMGIFSHQVSSCNAKGGQCFDISGTTCSDASGGQYTLAYPLAKCDTEGETCCLPGK